MSRQRGAGWLYVTDGGSSNPYAQPPSCWNLETSVVANQDVQDPYATSRPPSQNESGNPVGARVSFRWTAVEKSGWNVFIETDQQGHQNYRPSHAALTIAPDFLLQISKDGQTHLLRYTGNGTEWEWEGVSANAQSFTLSEGAVLAEAGSAALGGA